MYTTTHLNGEFQDYAENKMRATAKRERLLKFLDRDILNGIIESDGVFWIEPVAYYNRIPDYVYDEIVKWGTKIKGLRYLYSLKPPTCKNGRIPQKV